MAGTKADAREFIARWRAILDAIPAGKSNEQQDTAKFWQDLLVNVLGVPSGSMATFVDFERKVRGRRIDVFVSRHPRRIRVEPQRPTLRRAGDRDWQQAHRRRLLPVHRR